MRKEKARILTSFDWFVMAVIMGYLFLVVQGTLDRSLRSLPFTPSSQLQYDDALPPHESPGDASLSMASETVVGQPR